MTMPVNPDSVAALKESLVPVVREMHRLGIHEMTIHARGMWVDTSIKRSFAIPPDSEPQILLPPDPKSTEEPLSG